MKGAFIMVGRYSGDQNLGFNSFMYLFVLFQCKKTGTHANKLLTRC
jgi:hypothetical protein